MKICLLGSQGTGKSTLVNSFREQCRVVDGIARNVIAHGGASNQTGNSYSQRRIFNDYREALKGDYLSTRSMIDVYAYTQYLVQHYKLVLYNPFSVGEYLRLRIELWRELYIIKRWLSKNSDVVICYIPIEFDLVEDGVRSLNKEYQKAIDKNMNDIFNELMRSGYISRGYVITGPLQDRIAHLNLIINTTSK